MSCRDIVPRELEGERGIEVVEGEGGGRRWLVSVTHFLAMGGWVRGWVEKDLSSEKNGETRKTRGEGLGLNELIR